MICPSPIHQADPKKGQSPICLVAGHDMRDLPYHSFLFEKKCSRCNVHQYWPNV